MNKQSQNLSAHIYYTTEDPVSPKDNMVIIDNYKNHVLFESIIEVIDIESILKHITNF